MADFYGTARTNYFPVRDREAFAAALDGTDLNIEDGDGLNAGKVAVFADDCDYGTWPTYRYIEDNDEDEEFDIASTIGKHIEPGHIAYGAEVGHEKLRYLGATAWAVTSEQGPVFVNLDSTITALARATFGPDAVMTANAY